MLVSFSTYRPGFSDCNSGDNEAGVYAAEHPEVAVIETSVNICEQVCPQSTHSFVAQDLKKLA